jgi:hypothetical protein
VIFEQRTVSPVTNDAGKETTTMNAVRRFLTRGSRVTGGSTRFNRYYSGVLRSGSGYPTADEARKDLRSYDRTISSHGWPR